MLLIENIFQAGTITKAHAFSGQVKIVFLNSYQPEQEPTGFVFLMINKKPVPFFVEESTQFTSSSLILKLEGIDTLERAKELIGLDIYLDKSLRADSSKDEFQIEYFVGFSIFDQENTEVGIVRNVIENPAHYILETATGSLIPFHEDFLIRIDADAKAIYLQIPDGLLS